MVDNFKKTYKISYKSVQLQQQGKRQPKLYLIQIPFKKLCKVVKEESLDRERDQPKEEERR